MKNNNAAAHATRTRTKISKHGLTLYSVWNRAGREVFVTVPDDDDRPATGDAWIDPVELAEMDAFDARLAAARK
jgi:hypothetical protein